MRATQAYHEATGRAIGPKTLEFIADLVAAFEDVGGDEAVADEIERQAPAGQFDKLLGRVRDALAHRRARRTVTPTFVDDGTLLAIVRGQSAEPLGVWYYDGRSLRADEYDELLRWATERREGRVLEAIDG